MDYSIYEDLRDQSKTKRAQNRKTSAALLEKHHIQFTSCNKGAHLIVEGVHGLIDFWPGTGKWIVRNGGYTKRGVFNLIRAIQTGRY